MNLPYIPSAKDQTLHEEWPIPSGSTLLNHIHDVVGRILLNAQSVLD
jgi:hypothetical protein